MPAVQRSEFYLALNQVATERGVDVDVVLDTVKNAILAAYRKDHPMPEEEEELYHVDINQNTGEARVMKESEDVTPPGFGRIAAQTAKQVILQKVREKEKEAILNDYRDKVGQVVPGMILRFVGPNLIVDIGRAEALMPVSEQIVAEKYYVNQRFSVYIVEIREGIKGEEIIVSRAHSGLLEGLFKREVPEIAQGTVIVKAIAREAGARTKIAVAATQGGIDPVGSCVGQKGVRVQAVIQEFGGMEKIDIIEWDQDMRRFLAQALSPAKDVQVVLNEDTKTAHVTVPNDQLSLVIGKEGQNVRLASKLTGYRIEVQGKEEAGSLQPEEPKEEEVVKDDVSEQTKEDKEIKEIETSEEVKTTEEDKEPKKSKKQKESSEEKK